MELPALFVFNNALLLVAPTIVDATIVSRNFPNVNVIARIVQGGKKTLSVARWILHFGFEKK